MSEEQLLQLIAYIKSLSQPERRAGDAPRRDPPVAATTGAQHGNAELPQRRLRAQVLAVDGDHKRIALLYLVSITVFFLLGGLFAMVIRLELLTPAGDLCRPRPTTRCSRMHGVMMVFFFLIPSIPAVLGNFLLPIMIGAKDLAFPRINLSSWYIYIVGGTFTLCVALSGGVDTGWTFYTPYSTAVVELVRHPRRRSASSSPASRRS